MASKVFAMLLCWGLHNIDHCLQLSTSNFLEEVVDLSAIIDTIVAMMRKALQHTCPNPITSFYHHSASSAASSLFSQPDWPHVQDQGVSYGHQIT